MAEAATLIEYLKNKRRDRTLSEEKMKSSMSLRKKKKKVSTPKSDPELWKTTERALTENLNEDLLDAFQKIRSFSLNLGDQRVYASGKAIMFSKKTCFFFVRPKKSFLEVVIFLRTKTKFKEFKSVQAVSKTKFAHTFKLFHSDQVEGELTKAIEQSYLLSV